MFLYCREGDIDKDVVRLEIYNKRLETTTIEQVPAVTWEQVMGNAGGLFGLWLGASMLTFLEFFEFIANILFFFFEQMRRCAPVAVQVMS